MDSRPSDAIALALRVGAPIFVDDDVVQRAQGGGPSRARSATGRGRRRSRTRRKIKEWLETRSSPGTSTRWSAARIRAGPMSSGCGSGSSRTTICRSGEASPTAVETLRQGSTPSVTSRGSLRPGAGPCSRSRRRPPLSVRSRAHLSGLLARRCPCRRASPGRRAGSASTSSTPSIRFSSGRRRGGWPAGSGSRSCSRTTRATRSTRTTSRCPSGRWRPWRSGSLPVRGVGRPRGGAIGPHRRDAGARGVPHPVAVIPTGVPVERFCPGDRRAARRELGCPRRAGAASTSAGSTGRRASSAC